MRGAGKRKNRTQRVVVRFLCFSPHDLVAAPNGFNARRNDTAAVAVVII